MVLSPATPQATANPIIINLPSIDPSNEKEKIKKSFPKRTMMILSILQIICGCLAVLFQVAHYFVDGRRYRYGPNIYIAGWGIWTGIIFAASGIVGLIGAFKPSKCMMIAFLVLNIIASIFATLFLIVPESIGVAFFAGSSYYEGVVNVFHLYCIMLIVGLVQALTSIVAAGYSCSAICCGENQNYPGMVIYSPSLASNTNQSHFVPQVFQASTTPEYFVNSQNNPHTATDSTFAEVSLDAQKVNENEKNEQQDCPPNYEEANGQKYQRF